MKVHVEIDCTPEEARRFMGLPDLNSVHDVYVDKLKAGMGNGVTPDIVQGLMKAWSGAAPAMGGGAADGITTMQQLFGAFANGLAAGSSQKKTAPPSE